MNERKEYKRKWYLENLERMKEKMKKWATENKEKTSGYKKKWAENNKEKIKEKNKKYWCNNKEKILQRRRKYWETSEKFKKYQKEWKEENKEWIRKYHRERLKKLRQIPSFRLSFNIGTGIQQALKGKKHGRKWETLVGYTKQDLTHHLEKQFDDKMSWQNYGSYWHIDHIVPKSWFPYQTAEEQAFKDCWGLANLQPLEAKANMKKHNKYSYAK